MEVRVMLKCSKCSLPAVERHWVEDDVPPLCEEHFRIEVQNTLEQLEREGKLVKRDGVWYLA